MSCEERRTYLVMKRQSYTMADNFTAAVHLAVESIVDSVWGSADTCGHIINCGTCLTLTLLEICIRSDKFHPDYQRVKPIKGKPLARSVLLVPYPTRSNPQSTGISCIPPRGRVSLDPTQFAVKFDPRKQFSIIEF